MYIGHFSAAGLLLSLNPSVPVLPVAVGAAYPDLLWPALVLLKREKVKVDPVSPLQSKWQFIFYPYSHSLVRSAALTLIPAALAALIYGRPIVGVFFWLAAVSHWLLDLIMHKPDLPVLGFGKDMKVGAGLWRYAKTSFLYEFGLYALAIWLFAPPSRRWLLLGVGAALHALNANAFFGFTNRNPVKTAAQQAILTLGGFAVAIAAFTLSWT